MNALELLANKPNFTDSECFLADYILANVDRVTEMTIGSLAEATHCSSATIVRLCRKLGLEGYRELRIELARELERARMRILQVNPDRPFIEGANTADIVNSIMVLSKQGLEATYKSMSIGSVQRAARLLLGARRIVYYAIGDSRATADAFAQLLYKIGLVCTPGMPKGDFGLMERMLDPRDLALVITYSGNVIDQNQRAFEAFKASTCKKVVITADATLRERLQRVDCMVMLPKGESFNGRLATFYSQECIRYALNCIYAETFAANYRQNLDNWFRSNEYADEGE